jgi:hypothetical protein
MEQLIESPRVEPWMRGVLLLASAYNIGWGFFIYNFPESFYQWVSQTEGQAPAIVEWQGLGVLFFGFVYLAVAIYPATLWYLLLLGIASKAIGAAWFYFDIMEQSINKKYLFHLIMNDLVWLLPFVLIVIRAYKVRQLKTS